jgi:phosphatidylglycerol:prolipoprotein diacylglycerol transferase
MLPYFRQPELSIGSFKIHAFGALVALAVLVGSEIVRRRALRARLEPLAAASMVSWIVLVGFAGAHLVDRLIYFPRATMADPMSLLRFWEGISSFGGFLFGGFGAWLFFRSQPEGFPHWKYVDAAAYAFPFSWLFGRTGCFLAYDHPGLPTDFFLGQRYSDGVVRHNLGLYEDLYTVPIALAFLVLGRQPRFPGFFLGLFIVLYGPFRFLADFLRKVDVRYFGLTPGQYGTIGLLALGLIVLARGRSGRLGSV